jgi:dihydroorotate dehydrogenase electron transfer subunit
VAGGIGVTPVVAAARALARAGVGFDAVVAAQTASRLWGTDVLEELGAQVDPSAQVVVCTDDGSAGVKGFPTVVVPQLLAERSYTQIWTCGPAPMMAGVARFAKMAQIACQASLERLMTCGFGACHCCNVELAAGGYAFCCTDGPVFDAEEVAW